MWRCACVRPVQPRHPLGVIVKGGGMSRHIGMKDFENLKRLAKQSGMTVMFDYEDRNGSTSTVNAVVDSSTVDSGSLLVRTKDGQYRRYRFDRLRSDITAG